MTHTGPSLRDEDSLDRVIGALATRRPNDRDLLAAVERKLFSKNSASYGRYEILERIGSGGMGSVYRAFDPELDRYVALKLVKGSGPDRESATARLIHEARAMAELNHPNVVKVFDVGLEHGTVYISMELVQGTDLLRWLQREKRSWDEILEVFIAAGEGLAAAHSRGIVHRDFKPSNVLVGLVERGDTKAVDRVLVADFGLAAVVDRSDESTQSQSGSPLELPSRDFHTQTGIAVGTPAYMPPEQHRRGRLDARTDEYAFCASLYDALYRRRPFSGSSLELLLRSKQEGPPRPRTSADVPAWIFPILRRGMSANPDDRYPSVRAVLTALQSKMKPRPSRPVLLGAGAALLGGGVVWALAAPSGLPCEDESDLSGVWDDARATELRESIDRYDASAEGTWSRVQPRLDRWAESWTTVRADTCEAYRSRQLTDEAFDARTLCLQRHRAQVATTLDVLIASTGAIDKVIDVLATLPAPDTCESAESDPSQSPPTVPRDTVDRLRRELVQAHTLVVLGQLEPALALAESSLAQARQLKHKPLEAQALFEIGSVRKAQNRPEVSRDFLVEAALLATSVRNDHVAALAAMDLVNVTGCQLADFEGARRWERHARATIERASDPEPLRVDLEIRVASAETCSGRPDRAIGRLREVVTQEQDTTRSAVALGLLADALLRNGDFEGGLATSRKALETTVETYGPHHSMTALSHMRLANAMTQRGRFDAAIDEHRRAVEIFEAALGPDHGSTLSARANYAAALHRLGRNDAALDQLDLVIATYEADERFARHPNRAIAHSTTAEMLVENGKFADALEHARRSLQLRETIFGVQSGQLVPALLPNALALIGLGRVQEAWKHLHRAEALLAAEDAIPKSRLFVRFAQARAYLADGQPARAVEVLRRQLRAPKMPLERNDRVDVLYWLARAHWAAGDRKQALIHARAASEEIEALGVNAELQRMRLEQWLSDNGVAQL